MNTVDSPTTAWDRNHERGSYAVISGLLMASLVGLAAFSVDISLITMAELQVQATADAASHAALVAYRTSGGNQATGIAAANWIVGKDKVAMGVANVDSIVYGRWNYTAGAFGPPAPQINAAQAIVSRTQANNNAVELLLAPILGVTHYDVQATAVTAEQLRAMMLVMDMSCSMMVGDINVANSPVNVGRAANIGFLDYMVANPQIGDLLGLSMFAQFANRTPTLAAPAGTRVSTNYPAFAADPPWLPLSPLDTQQALVRQRINGICDTQVSTNTLCVPGARHPVSGTIGNATNPGPAMFQAVNELTNSALVNATYFKGMLFFSDGWPNAGLGAGGGTQASNLAWQNDIYVWTILFANGGGDPAYMTSLVRGAPLAFSQTSQNVADMPAMYEAVAKSLPTALVK